MSGILSNQMKLQSNNSWFFTISQRTNKERFHNTTIKKREENPLKKYITREIRANRNVKLKKLLYNIIV